MAAFAVTMGVGAQMAARLGKARNPLWMGQLGLMIGVIGWYAHWAAWLAIADAGSFGSLLGDPRAMWGFASLVAEHEARSIMGMRIEGSVLVAGWIIEFILLTSLPRSLARTAAETPFCELTDAWAEMFELPRKFAWIDEPHVAVHRLESAPGQLFSILDDCPEADPRRYSAITPATREMPDSQIVTSYISALTQAGHPARAMPYLDELRTLYMRQGCTEATVLAARRIPLFGIFLQNSLPIVRKVLGDAEGRAWYAAMAAHLDQAGQGDLASWLEASFAGETSTTS